MPTDPDFPIIFEDNQDSLQGPPYFRVITGTDLIFYGGDYLTGTYIPGEYMVELRAWTENGGEDTGYF